MQKIPCLQFPGPETGALFTSGGKLRVGEVQMQLLVLI
jgi:hypothetical protein